MKEERRNAVEIEERQVKTVCDAILAPKLDLVITASGVASVPHCGFILECEVNTATLRSCSTLPPQGKGNSSPPC